MSGTGVIFIALVAAANFDPSMAQQVSNTGCACKSTCEKSLLGSSGPWCYVDSKCKSNGWDSCQDAQMLLVSAVKEKAQEESSRAAAEKEAAALKNKLDMINTQRALSESTVFSLKKQLAETSAKEATARKRAEKAEHEHEKAEHEVVDVQRKDLAALKDIQQKLSASTKETTAAKEQMKEVQQKLEKAEDSAKQNDVTIKVMQQKIMHAEEAAQKGVERKLQQKLQGEKKLLEAQAAAQAAETKAEAKLKETEDKLAQVSKKQSDQQIELQKVGQELKATKDGVKQQVADMERLVKEKQDTEMKLKNVEETRLKQEATSKSELAKANQKHAETE